MQNVVKVPRMVKVPYDSTLGRFWRLVYDDGHVHHVWEMAGARFKSTRCVFAVRSTISEPLTLEMLMKADEEAKSDIDFVLHVLDGMPHLQRWAKEGFEDAKELAEIFFETLRDIDYGPDEQYGRPYRGPHHA